jgi:hypothetical protein
MMFIYRRQLHEIVVPFLIDMELHLVILRAPKIGEPTGALQFAARTVVAAVEHAHDIEKRG